MASPIDGTKQDAQGWDWLIVDDVPGIEIEEKNIDSPEHGSSVYSPQSQSINSSPKSGIVETPKNRDPLKKFLARRRLTFDVGETTYQVLQPENPSEKCVECSERKIIVRAKVADEHSVAAGEAGFAEVLQIVGEIPDCSLKHVLKRRPAVLPVKCQTTGQWVAPLYRCVFCDMLMYGISLDDHEETCNQ